MPKCLQSMREGSLFIQTCELKVLDPLFKLKKKPAITDRLFVLAYVTLSKNLKSVQKSMDKPPLF
jgi:hypothetical protein